MLAAATPLAGGAREAVAGVPVRPPSGRNVLPASPPPPPPRAAQFHLSRVPECQPTPGAELFF